MTGRRRRGLLLLCVALASGGMAASQVHERERRAAEALGPSVNVLVAARELSGGARLTRDGLAMRRVPARFAPPGALGQPAAVLGARIAVPVSAGAYLTAAVFEGSEERQGESALRRGQRVVTVEVVGGAGVAALASGSRVDVLVSSESGAGAGRTTMALAGAELLALGESVGSANSGEADIGSPAGPTVLATLRVSLRQAIHLTAADNFAREIRLLPRPPGDHAPAGGTVSEPQL